MLVKLPIMLGILRANDSIKPALTGTKQALSEIYWSNARTETSNVGILRLDDLANAV